MIFNPSTWSKYVFIALEGTSEAVPAGKLELLEEGIRPIASTFVYGNKYLQRVNAAAIDPVSTPLNEARKSKQTIFQPPAGLALFGAIRDAAPDSWGRRVIENMLRAAPDGLPETDYLAHAGPHRTGALDFRDSPTAPAEPGKLPDVKALSYLLDAAAMIQEGKPVPKKLHCFSAWERRLVARGRRPCYSTITASGSRNFPSPVTVSTCRSWNARRWNLPVSAACGFPRPGLFIFPMGATLC